MFDKQNDFLMQSGSLLWFMFITSHVIFSLELQDDHETITQDLEHRLLLLFWYCFN